MSINVFHIPFTYRGSTEALFRKALENITGPDYSKILYIAPSLSKIRDAQRIFHALAGDCYIPPVMMTLKQLSGRLFSLYGNRQTVPQALIPVLLSKLTGRNLGYACLMADFVYEMKEQHPGKNMTEITGDVRSAFEHLGIPEDVSNRALEALKNMELYQEVIRKSNAADQQDIMELCPDIIREHGIRYDSLIIDGLTELTRTDEDFIKALIGNSGHTIISIPYHTNYDDISIRYIDFLNNNFTIDTGYFPHENDHLHLAHYPYQDVESEIEGIARSIKNHFIAGVATDLDTVFVVFPQLHGCSDMIARIFQKYGIPFTLAEERPLAKTKPFLDVMALLESVSKDYPRLQFSQFLISPYFKAIPGSLREYIPSLCISSGFTHGKMSWLEMMKPDGNNPQRDFISKQAYQTITRDLASVFRRLSHLESIRHHASFTDYGEAILKLLLDFDFDEGMNNDRNNLETMIITVNELSRMDTLTDNSPTDLHYYTEALRHCLLNVTSTERDTPGVRILSFAALCGREPEYLYFGGLRDGDFPSKPEIDHLMPDNVRKELGLMHIERYLRQQKFLFTRALSSAEQYHLSYAVMEGDRLFLPSSFLPWSEEMPKPVYGVFSKEEYFIRKAGELRSSFVFDIQRTDKRLVQKLFGEKSPVRVTDIDAYRACPRKFFIERLLSLKPLEILKFEMQALTLGTIVHEIMQEIVSDFSPDSHDFALKAGKKLDALLSKKTLDSYWKRVIKDTFLSVLPLIFGLEQNIAGDGYVFTAAEVPVQSEVLPGITLKGKIDRIDKKTMGKGPLAEGDSAAAHLNAYQASSESTVAELIDYKSGAPQFSGSQLLSQGVNLQLMLYAALMKSMGTHVDRVGIYSLKNLTISWIPGRDDIKNGRTLNDYVAAAMLFLEETVSKMRAGEFPARPLVEQTCRNCPDRPYCPYIQKSAMVKETP
jgi:ATP-dependent helicase/DNAse subunit B